MLGRVGMTAGLVWLIALTGCGQPTPPTFDRDRLSYPEEARNTVAGDTGQNGPRPQFCDATTPGGCGDGGVCVPVSCEGLGLNCGDAPDGCGSQMNCGDCPAGTACVGNVCGGAAQ